MITNLAADVLAFTSNVFLVEGERTVLVDAGANFDVARHLSRHDPDLDAIVITHTHPDHIGNVDDIRAEFGVESWGFDLSSPAVDSRIEDRDRVRLGDHEYRAIHTPGHKDDHLCFYADGPEICFSGDLVFQNGGYGRTDLPEGDHERLLASLRRLADIVAPSLEALHPGHGPSVTTDPYEDIELALKMARFG